MRYGKGIGWLIFGIIVCASCVEAYGLAAKLSTIALGLVFVAVFFIKNWFDPQYKALFVIGGMLVAFCIENGRDEATYTSLVCAALFFAAFYLVNRDLIKAWLAGEQVIDDDDEYEEYEEYVEELPEEDPTGDNNGGNADQYSEYADDGNGYQDMNQVPHEEDIEFEFDRTDS